VIWERGLLPLSSVVAAVAVLLLGSCSSSDPDGVESELDATERFDATAVLERWEVPREDLTATYASLRRSVELAGQGVGATEAPGRLDFLRSWILGHLVTHVPETFAGMYVDDSGTTRWHFTCHPRCSGIVRDLVSVAAADNPDIAAEIFTAFDQVMGTSTFHRVERSLVDLEETLAAVEEFVEDLPRTLRKHVVAYGIDTASNRVLLSVDGSATTISNRLPSSIRDSVIVATDGVPRPQFPLDD
jgi:hypothetical protein